MSLPQPVTRRDTVLDPWIDTYAERTHGLTVSAVRALFSVANRPEVVSLAGGMPNIADLPREAVGEALAALISDRGAPKEDLATAPTAGTSSSCSISAWPS